MSEAKEILIFYRFQTKFSDPPIRSNFSTWNRTTRSKYRLLTLWSSLY